MVDVQNRKKCFVLLVENKERSAYNRAEYKHERAAAMHEYSLTKQIVTIANNTAKANHAARINTVSVVLGEHSGIIPDSVQMYFDMIAAGTEAEGAALRIRMVKQEMHCPSCNRNFIRPRFSFACPDCGTLGNPTDTGNEYYVESVELEIDEKIQE